MAERRHRPPPLPPHIAVPVAAARFLAVRGTAAALHGRLPAWGVLTTSGLIVALATAASGLWAAPGVVAIGWLSVVGFSSAPYGTLTGTGRPTALAGAVLSVTAGIGVGAGAISRG